MISALGANDLRNELLRVFHLERIGTEPLEQGYSEPHAWVADDNRLRSSPFLVGKFLHRNEIHFRRERSAVVERFANEIDQQWNVRGRNGMTPRPKHIQCVSIPEEHRRLSFAYDHL